VLALGGKGEKVVEGGHAIDPTQWQFELMRDIDEQIIAQIAEGLLRSVQHLDQRILLEAESLQGAVDEVEARISAGMFIGWSRARA